ncbi:restriction endonuclease [Methanococcoides seepicolus]|uniref:Restriction endonuclease n=1 Tax=Methanococcoides seepicolus TaxID=2828780 RepID=A0A9E5DDV2_9EURY|nr:restriction endonuclease [Methanococcoides seepicolus]MCM1988078.1 restriction endonuclease [Methanococcoides seepicolus]
MPRKGKELEETVSLLHKILSNDKYEIKSPDFIIDKITGQKREVDISIKLNAGSIPLTIIIECRDRNSKQDSMWIEQLVTKCMNLNVQKVIAVSSNNFTEPAKTMAKHNGIETRILNQINKQDIESWFLGDSLEIMIKRSEIVNMPYFELVDYDGNDLKFEGTDNIFLSSGDEFSLNEIFNREVIVKQDQIYNDVPEDGSRIQKTIDFIDEEHTYKMKTSETKTYQLKGFTAEFYLWKELKKIPISEIYRYSDSVTTFLEGIKFSDFEFNGGKLQISLVKRFE